MLIGNEGRRSDLRVVYGMLASSALAQFDAARADEDKTEVRDVYFLNIIRLLEMYRYGSFYSPPPNGVLETKPLVANPLSYSGGNQDSKLILNALERAHKAVSDEPREQFVQLMEEVFQAVYRRDVKALPQENLKKAKEFLKQFVAELCKGLDSA